MIFLKTFLLRFLQEHEMRRYMSFTGNCGSNSDRKLNTLKGAKVLIFSLSSNYHCLQAFHAGELRPLSRCIRSKHIKMKQSDK